MKHCPYCGKELAASLVDAIDDPNRDESCPRRPKLGGLVVRMVPKITNLTVQFHASSRAMEAVRLGMAALAVRAHG